MGCIQIQGLSWGGQWNLSLILNIITDNFSQLEMCTCVTLGTVGSNQEDSQELIWVFTNKNWRMIFFPVFLKYWCNYLCTVTELVPPLPPHFSSSPVLAFTTQVSLWLSCHQLQGTVRSGHSTLRAVLHAVEVALNNPCGQTGKIFCHITRSRLFFVRSVDFTFCSWLFHFGVRWPASDNSFLILSTASVDRFKNELTDSMIASHQNFDVHHFYKCSCSDASNNYKHRSNTF